MGKDSITGRVIEVVYPYTPDKVGTPNGREIQFSFKGESKIRLGEVTGWLSRCIGKHCNSKQARTFELNTFSDQGLMYIFPLAQ